MKQVKITSIIWELDNDYVVRPEIIVGNEKVKFNTTKELEDLGISIGDYACIEDNKIVDFINTKVVNINNKPSRCPECDQLLAYDGINLKCINPFCAARVRCVLERMLYRTYFHWYRFLKRKGMRPSEYFKKIKIISFEDAYSRSKKELGEVYSCIRIKKKLRLKYLFYILPYTKKYFARHYDSDMEAYFGRIGNVINATKEKLELTPGISPTKINDFVNETIFLLPLIKEISKRIKFAPCKEKVIKGHSLQGVVVVYKSSRKMPFLKEIKEVVEKNGGVVKKFCSIFQKCDIMVLDDSENIVSFIRRRINKMSCMKINYRDFCKMLKIPCSKTIKKENENG